MNEFDPIVFLSLLRACMLKPREFFITCAYAPGVFSQIFNYANGVFKCVCVRTYTFSWIHDTFPFLPVLALCFEYEK